MEAAPGLDYICRRIEALIQTHVASAELSKCDDEALVFILPVEESPKFPDMFEEIETAKEELGVDSFGLSLTTMEDVFLKIGEMTEEEGEKKPVENSVHIENGGGSVVNGGGNIVNVSHTAVNGGTHVVNGSEKLGAGWTDPEMSLSKPEILSGGSLVWSQMVGLLVKRMTYTWRRKIFYSIMMLIPLAMAVFTVVSINP